MYATAGSDRSTRAYSIDEVVRGFWDSPSSPTEVLNKKHWADFELHGDPFPAPSCGLCVLGNLQASSREDSPGGRPMPSTLDRCQKHHKHRNNVWGNCRSTRTLILRSSESFEGTGRWFLDHERYNQWLAQPSSFLWLCGSPGAGKSVLMSTVIRDLEKTRRAEELVVYYFANGNYRGVSTAKAILCSMLGQLLFRKPVQNSFAEVLPLLNDVIAAGSSLSVTSIAWLFSKIRHKLRSHETLYLLLDGLDEVIDNPSERELVLELIDQASRHDPNHQIKCFISSRSTFFGTSLPKGALRVDLDSHPLTRNDMSLYVQDSLHKFVFAYPSRDIKDLEERVLNLASGSFLLLHLILQQAGSGGSNSRAGFKDLLVRLSDFSEIELGRIYDGMLAGIENGNKEAALSMLRWVTFAARPLELHELLVLYKQTGVETKEEDISTISAGLLINSGNQIRFAHFSVREYLESHLSETWEALSDEANEKIAHTCLKLIPTQDLLQSLGLTSEKCASTERTTNLDFVPYARIHWMFHYKRAERRSRYLAGLLHNTLENSLKISRKHGLGLGMDNTTKITFERFSGAENLQLDTEQHNFESPNVVNIALAVSAEFGFSKLAELELDMGADPNVLSGPEQQTPLCLAAKWGHLEVVKLLLHRGADPSIASWSGLTPVAYAMANGHYEIRQFLVSHPAKGLWRSNTYEEWSGDQNATQAMLLTASLSPSCTCSDYWVNYEVSRKRETKWARRILMHLKLRAVPEICENTGKSLPPIMVSGETISESELQLSLNSMSLENSRSVSIVVRWYPGVPMYRVLKSVSKRGIDDVRKLLLAVGNDKDRLDMVISVSKLLAKSTL